MTTATKKARKKTAAVGVACSACSATQDTKAGRVSMGWKRLPAGVLCQTCFRSRYVLRAVTFPVSGPVGAEWKELREALKVCWGQSTRLANWAVMELVKADVTRTATMKKLPPLPPDKKGGLYLYGAMNAKYPDRSEWARGASSAQSVLRLVRDKYKAARYDVIWLGKADHASFRYPVPYPVHNQQWEASFLEYEGKDGHVSRVPAVSVTLAGTKFTLRLAGGPEFKRQLAAFGQIASGAAIQGELAFYRVRSHTNDHRNGVAEREPGGGERVSYRVMAKLVAWLPRKPPGERLHTMLVRTDPNAFVVAEVEGRQPWILNADHVRRWVEAHRVYRQRMSEDLKHEKRWPADVRRHMVESLGRRCDKQKARLDSFVHEASAQLANYAARCKVGEVIYDPACKTYLPSFPWYRFREKLAYKLDERGIALTGGR